MPIWKYHSVADMPPPPRCSDDENLAVRIRDLWDRAARLTGCGYPPGVYRFHSVEEAQTARKHVIGDRVRKLRGEVMPHTDP
jgi:hypothetical protein